MSKNYILNEYFILYLRDVRNLSESSINHYLDALNNISRYLVENNKINKEIYELEDLRELDDIKRFLYSDDDFMALDKRGHQMYSSGLNNYYRFANGEDFQKERKKLEILDIEIPVRGQVLYEQNIWKRSGIIKKQSIEAAGNLCECDNSHITFIAESNMRPYMEGHHAIPFNKQKYFKNSLDVYANIISLCPICHRLLHYGLKQEKINLLNQIYDDRVIRLQNSGLKISRSEFIDIVF